ncbi:MAG TPA: glycoside hydrolase family 15 protein [Solirubrobacterales bacterium]|nr:glycoside hydrolase family 15 protein [Solirubrobacterales bacterium]
MGWARAALALVAVLTAGALLLSGGSGADPKTPPALPEMPPPFLGTAVVGDGGLTAAVDAYGDVVDLRPSPAGPALIENPSARQAAGSVPSDTGIVPLVSLGGGRPRPLWTADSVRQRYLSGTNMVVTTARFGARPVRILYAAGTSSLACLTRSTGGVRISLRVAEPAVARRLRCDDRVARLTVRAAKRNDRRWLHRARPLGPGAPAWATAMYQRSLLVLRALTNARSGAVAAGARDGWAYVWPRDAATAAMAYAAAGYRGEAERVTRFLLGLGLDQAARFHGDGSPVAGRVAQGDAVGWVAAAARAAGLVDSAPQAARILTGGGPIPWRDRPDYREQGSGDYLGNALASAADVSEFSRHIWGESSGTPSGLVREAGDPDSGLDSAAAWAVRPFSTPHLYPAARATLNHLAAQSTRYGITPGEGWDGGEDPWTAPTAWSARSLAALGERHAALRLLTGLRRAATPAGTLPERVDARSGLPRSTTPLAWSHAFAILALRQLWPSR